MGNPYQIKLKRLGGTDWPDNECNEENCDRNKNDRNVEEVTSLFDGIQQCEANDAEEWLNCDSNDQGFLIVTDQETADAVVKVKPLSAQKVTKRNLPTVTLLKH